MNVWPRGNGVGSEKIMKKHLGSTISLIVGVLSFISGVTNLNGLVITGPIIILGALSYRSAKKRRLGDANNSLLRKGLEISAIAAIVLAIVTQNNLRNLLITDPVPNLIIPLFAIIAYAIIAFRKPMIAVKDIIVDDEKDKVRANEDI